LANYLYPEAISHRFEWAGHCIFSFVRVWQIKDKVRFTTDLVYQLKHISNKLIALHCNRVEKTSKYYKLNS